MDLKKAAIVGAAALALLIGGTVLAREVIIPLIEGAVETETAELDEEALHAQQAGVTQADLEKAGALEGAAREAGEQLALVTWGPESKNGKKTVFEPGCYVVWEADGRWEAHRFLIESAEKGEPVEKDGSLTEQWSFAASTDDGIVMGTVTKETAPDGKPKWKLETTSPGLGSALVSLELANEPEIEKPHESIVGLLGGEDKMGELNEALADYMLANCPEYCKAQWMGVAILNFNDKTVKMTYRLHNGGADSRGVEVAAAFGGSWFDVESKAVSS